MRTNIRTYGRTELAQAYFPALKPHSAWLKLKDLLLLSPATSAFALQSRRSFLPAEVSAIFASLGEP